MTLSSGCRLYLVRHGETANAHRNCFNGHNDVALSLKGLDQMKIVAEALSKKSLRQVYSSDLQRTREGAILIAKPHNLKPIPFPELKEINFGKWEAMGFDEINQKYPGELEHYFKTIATIRVGGGETIREVHDRAVPKIEKLVEKHSDNESIVVVAHGGVNRILLCHFLGIPWEQLDRIQQNFAAVNIIQFYNEGPVVELMNGSHLHIP